MKHTIILEPNRLSRRTLGPAYDEIPKVEAGDQVRMVCEECAIDVVLHCVHNNTSLCYSCWGYRNFASGLCTQLNCKTTQTMFIAVEDLLEDL